MAYDLRSASDEIRRLWANSGIERPYEAEEVVRLRGRVRVEHSLARQGAERLWWLLHERPYVPALGAMTGGQAVQMVRAGLEAIYLSGWQVAADANLGEQVYPDQSLYPANSVPAVVRRISNALRRADQIEFLEGDDRHWMAPIVADAEAGFGGPLNAYELMRQMIESGAAGVHFEDQLASEKKCGHLGGKVLVPTSQFERTLAAARLAADVADVPTVLIARTDALSATLITSDVDERDREFLTGERTPEGYFRVAGGIDSAIARGLAYAPYADLIWCETSTPDLDEAQRFAEAIHAAYPGQAARVQLLALVQLAAPPRRRDHRAVPARARSAGLPVPVHHARGLPRPVGVDVRARAGLCARGHERLRTATGARVRARGRRLHGDAPPARGRCGLVRPARTGGVERGELDARADRLDRGRAVLSPSSGGRCSAACRAAASCRRSCACRSS